MQSHLSTTRTKLAVAMQIALSFSAAACLGLAAPASAQSTPPATPSSKKKAETLQTIQVTGSHISRAELETANPVLKVTPEQIRQSGDLTLSDVIQQLPQVTGPINGPDIVNGGSIAGSTDLSLHAMGPSRTLVLINGERVLNKNISAIPLGAVQSIQVLTDGASAVYGSSAIGGVINVILKPTFKGIELQANGGVSSHGDGVRQGYSLVAGDSTKRSSIVAGISYNKTNAILATSRSFSKQVLSITGSTNTPIHAFVSGDTFPFRGLISLPPSLQSKFGCPAVSLNRSASGQSAPTTLADYHCFNNATDLLNDGLFSELDEATERTNMFVNGTYKFTPNISGYYTVLHNYSTAGGFFPPAVFTTLTGTAVSQFSMYNPFGAPFSNDTNAFRFTNPVDPPRIAQTNQTTDQVMVGLRGNWMFLGHHWSWNVGYNFGHVLSSQVAHGWIDVPTLNTSLGPSMLVNGVPTCVATPGDAATAIAGCTPMDPFNMRNPADKSILEAADVPGTFSETQTERIESFGVNGGLFDLPAGTVELALGGDYRSQYSDTIPGVGEIANNTGFCALGTECTAPLQGGFNVRTAYGELFVPILRDEPFARSLSVDLGDRLSRYSDFGSTNNWKIGVQYRPIKDLLLRGTISKVFRAPSISDLFAPSSFGAIFVATDPCDGITAPNPACVGVPTNGKFVDTVTALHEQMTALFSGSEPAHFPLGPESGKTFNFGVVYSPHQIPGLSASVDFWRLYLNDVITSVSAQTVLNSCFAGNTSFCPLIRRFPAGSPNAGQLNNFALPTVNLGRQDVKGIDFQSSYLLPALPIGQFKATLFATYMEQDDLQTAPGLSGNVDAGGAGVDNTDIGSLGFVPRVRAQTTVNWTRGPWEASWRLQYIGPFSLGSGEVARGFSAVPGFVLPVALHYGSEIYNDVQVGYDIRPLHTEINFGINNLANKQPPILFNSNAPSSSDGNTDGNNFDIIGRYYWARATLRFR